MAGERLTRDDMDFLRMHAKWWGNMLRVRLEHGAVKFGVSWKRDYSDADNYANLQRAVEHLAAALIAFRTEDARESRDTSVYATLAAELPKRAADVANQAFMLGDIERVIGGEANLSDAFAAREAQPARKLLDGTVVVVCNRCEGKGEVMTGYYEPEPDQCYQCDGKGAYAARLAEQDQQEEEPR